MGMTKEELTAAVPLAMPVPGKPYIYWAANSGPPDGPFRDYLFILAPETGLCIISARSAPVESDLAGTQLRRHFETVQRRIDEKYGKGRRFEQFGSDAPNADLAMLELLAKKRTLYAIWNAESSPKLGGHLSRIYLTTDSADTMDSATIGIVYFFKNAEKCDELLNASKRHPI
jgi:hypothetical protein